MINQQLFKQVIHLVHREKNSKRYTLSHTQASHQISFVNIFDSKTKIKISLRTRNTVGIWAILPTHD